MFCSFRIRKVWQKRKCGVKYGCLTISHSTVSTVQYMGLFILHYVTRGTKYIFGTVPLCQLTFLLSVNTNKNAIQSLNGQNLCKALHKVEKTSNSENTIQDNIVVIVKG